MCGIRKILGFTSDYGGFLCKWSLERILGKLLHVG